MQPGFRERGRENDREWNRYRNDRMDYRRRKNDGEYEIVPILSEDYD
ncbi:hypothetical protein FACS1894111_02150 [Clostridia bacterium]|nr:hypothetical protein FACS1894111_02150 [Clostridia bacterium]